MPSELDDELARQDLGCAAVLLLALSKEIPILPSTYSLDGKINHDTSLHLLP
jgi:hypothetical protein